MFSKIEPVFNYYIDTYFAKIKKQDTFVLALLQRTLKKYALCW